MSGSTIPDARARLLAWYDANARDLPWRRTRDPYAIWVSEVMLQQTRVDTVIPYYERFLARFPTMQSLASATEDEVLAMWSGLGYYRRARFLQRGVSDALTRFGGVPADPVERRGLPGIGAYTAGAIGSIAFDFPEPIVDGNVARVLSRFHRIAGTLGESTTTKELWALAATWAEGERPGALNQGLMELGATVCSPTAPACERCPLEALCTARANDETDRFPRVAPKAKPKKASWSAAILRDRDGHVVVVRGSDALFGGLHGLPTVEGERDALVASVRALAPDATLEDEPAFTVKHVLSHRALSVSVFPVVATEFAPGITRLSVEALDQVGVSRLTRKILEHPAAGAAVPPPIRATRARRGSRSPAR